MGASLAIAGLPQTVEAAPQPAYSAINKLVVPTNGAVRREAIAPPLLGNPTQAVSPDYDTNSSFQAAADPGPEINPDTHGAVGPNHVMAMLNKVVRIQNRTGTT